ncbi:LacI family DNA-binding transcriptional regulator [Cellulosilyticum sp. I15G10I2]|uniref:LacI family DNA-binding transcriptional regulator n=1 Tax=Cellulosilyticum sp. I15G10I2 TaxID=1892843 RepID=UPI00085BDF4D|nr:LacI family DNA-binding transcriptional regulator [Cellulosilyticum sp. I15G10I2]
MTITDIAKISGVGVSTVSRVINNHPDVKAETREKVLGIIKEYNYVPNNSARILKQSNTKNIGILVKGVFNPFFSAILKNISTSVEGAGYTMILQHHNNPNDLDTLVGFIKEKKLQGVICLGGNFIDIKEESFDDLEVAIVLLCVNMKTQKAWNSFSTIGIADDNAAYEATNYLIQNGHRNICIMLGDKDDLGVGVIRYEGYKKALEDNGLETKDHYLIYGEYEINKAYERATAFLKENKEVTAIFAISDMMAIGVAKAVVNLGLRIRDDISIVGFDGMDVAKYYEPTLTTVKQPKDELSKMSVDLLFELLSGESQNKHIVLDVELLEGNSTKKI